METFLLILFGIVLGWFIPRPYFIGDLEERLLGKLKRKVPWNWQWW